MPLRDGNIRINLYVQLCEIRMSVSACPEPVIILDSRHCSDSFLDLPYLIFRERTLQKFVDRRPAYLDCRSGYEKSNDYRHDRIGYAPSFAEKISCRNTYECGH